MQDKPRIATLVNTLANYNATIPAPTDPDAKPQKVRWRFVGFFLSLEKVTFQRFLSLCLVCQIGYSFGRVSTLFTKHLGSHPFHSYVMADWNGWNNRMLLHCCHVLYVGQFRSFVRGFLMPVIRNLVTYLFLVWILFRRSLHRYQWVPSQPTE